MVVKVEVFTAEPPCAGCVKLLGMADEITKTYSGKVKVVKHIGPSKEFDKYKLTLVPAVVIEEGKIMLMGVCPDIDTLTAALKEAGV